MPRSARKSTPSKSRSPAKAQHKYEYLPLDKVPLTSTESCNFYGVIIDATFPYKVDYNKFICSLKVVDPTLHSKGQFAQVILVGNKFEDLPIIHRVGDIIRVHRATLNLRNGRRQFSVNMFYQSSYALFSTDKQNPLGQTQAQDQPFAFSGKRATIEKQDTVILATLRKWANDYFAKNQVAGDRVVALNQASNQRGDFDVTARILQIFKLDEYTNELKLRDQSGTVFYTPVLQLKFPHLRQGSVVRIRCAAYDPISSKKILVLQHYSNIMTYINSSKLASSFSKVANDNSTEKAALKDSVTMTPVVLSEVDRKHQNLPTTSVYDLFHNQDNSTHTFRTCFFVTRIEPGNTSNAVRSFDRKSKKTAAASKGGDLIYQVQLLVKDVSTQNNNNVYRILLYTHEGLGSNFFPVKPATDAKSQNKLQNSFNMLTRFNSWVDAVVERRNGYYFIKDTKLVF